MADFNAKRQRRKSGRLTSEWKKGGERRTGNATQSRGCTHVLFARRTGHIFAALCEPSMDSFPHSPRVLQERRHITKTLCCIEPLPRPEGTHFTAERDAYDITLAACQAKQWRKERNEGKIAVRRSKNRARTQSELRLHHRHCWYRIIALPSCPTLRPAFFFAFCDWTWRRRNAQATHKRDEARRGKECHGSTPFFFSLFCVECILTRLASILALSFKLTDCMVRCAFFQPFLTELKRMAANCV